MKYLKAEREGQKELYAIAFMLAILVFALPAESSVRLSGIVKDSAGQPVPYAWVKAELFPLRKTVSRMTNTRGEFLLENLEGGSYVVTAGRLGYKAETQSLMLHDKEAVSLDLTIETGFSPNDLSSAQWAAWFPQDEDTDLLQGTCSGCHNLSTPAEKREELRTKQQWESRIYSMSDNYMIPDLDPKLLDRISTILNKYWGGDAKMPAMADIPKTPVDGAALQATYTEYDIPVNYIRAHSATVDSHDRVWISGYDWISNAVAMFDIAAEKFQFWKMPTPKSSPHTFAFDQDNIWIPESVSSKLGDIHPSTGELEEYKVPGENDHPYPHSAVVDSKGTVWVTCSFGYQLAEFDPKTKKVATHRIPADHKGSGFGYRLYFIMGASSRGKAAPLADPDGPDLYSIDVDSHDKIWFSEYNGGRVVKFDPSTGKFATYTPKLRGSTPRGIVVDSHDNVWFADFAIHRLGVLVPATGEIVEYEVPTPRGTPYGLALDSAGNIWYSDFDGNKIVEFDPRTRKFVEFPLPSTMSTPRFFGFDSKGRLWYPEFQNGKIGMIDFGPDKHFRWERPNCPGCGR
jgi:streptogramin lyase